MHLNWECFKNIKSILFGSMFLRVPKGILFRNKELEKILKIKSIDKVRQKMGRGIEENVCFVYSTICVYVENNSLLIFTFQTLKYQIKQL